MPIDGSVGLGPEPPGEHRQHKGRNQQGEHLPQDGQEGTPKRDVGMGADQRERQGSHHGHHQVAGNKIGTHHADVGSQDQRDRDSSRSRWGEHRDKSALGNHRIERTQ